LATRAEVAASTVWRIEAGQVNPTVEMLERLRAAAGASSEKPGTREAAVSLALGRLTAAALLRDPKPILRKAQQRVRRLLADSGLPRGSRRWLEVWRTLLSGPLEDVVAALIDPSERGYELRQHLPFTGVLSDDERLVAIQRATREHRATRSA
jgi:transcriptional regulator with XRE-family HTH domain